MKVQDVAKYVIARYDNVGDLVTNKKLQKILYYIKAWGLVYFKDGVIDEPFEAWIHGPVCRPVYQEYKRFKYNPIEIDYKGLSSSLYINKFRNEQKGEDKDKVDLIDAVFQKYGKLTSLELELLTHSEYPWIEARYGLSPIETGDKVIKDATMYDFYSKNKE